MTIFSLVRTSVLISCLAVGALMASKCSAADDFWDVSGYSGAQKTASVQTGALGAEFACTLAASVTAMQSTAFNSVFWVLRETSPLSVEFSTDMPGFFLLLR